MPILHLKFNYYFEGEPMEAFSSHPGNGNAEETANSFPGINHKSIGTEYDGYAGHMSASTHNPSNTVDYNVDQRST